MADCKTKFDGLVREDRVAIQKVQREQGYGEETRIPAVESVIYDLEQELIETKQLVYEQHPEIRKQIAEGIVADLDLSKTEKKTILLKIEKGDWTIQDLINTYLEDTNTPIEEGSTEKTAAENVENTEEDVSVFDTETTILTNAYVYEEIEGRETPKSAKDIFTIRKSAPTILAKVNNFFQTLATKEGRDEIIGKYGLDAKYEVVLKGLVQFNKDFTEKLVELHKKGRSLNASKNRPLELLKDENGELPDNVTGAIAMVAYNWLGTRSGETLSVDPTGINAFLGKGSSETIDPFTQNAFNTLGLYNQFLAEQLGAEVRKTLGLSTKKTIDRIQDGQIDLDLGMMVLEGLAELNLIELNTVKQKEFNFILEVEDIEKGLNYGGQETEITFVRAKTEAVYDRDGEFAFERPTQNVESFKNAMEGLFEGEPPVKDVMKALFDAETNTFPSTKPIEKVPSLMKRGITFVSKVVKKGIKKYQSVPFNGKTNHLKFIDALDEKTLFKLAGAKKDAEVHADQVDSNQAINKDIATSYQTIRDWLISPNKGKDFFNGVDVWSNNRSGDIKSLISLQRDKRMRAFFGATDWTKTVDLTNPKKTGQNLAAIAIMESFGHTADKLTHGTILDTFYESVMDQEGNLTEEYQPGIKAIQKVINDGSKLSKKEQEAIIELNDKGGEDMHTFDGLVALAQLSQALKNKEESVEISLAREIDGVTNGIISAVIQYGVEFDVAKKILKAGGIHLEDSADLTWDNYPAFREDKNNRDNYQNIAVEANKHMFDVLKMKPEDLDDPSNALELAKDQSAIRGFFGIFDNIINEEDGRTTKFGRGLGKDPLMLVVYGASLAKIKAAQATKLLDDLYTKMVAANQSDTANEDATFQQQVTLLRNLDKILGQDSTLRYDIKKAGTVEKFIKENKGLKNYSLSEQDKATFLHRMFTTVGKATEVATESYLGDLIQHQRDMNTMFNLQAGIFKQLYNNAVEAKEKETGHKLTREEDAAIMEDFRKRSLLPGAKHASSTSNQDTIQVVNTERMLLPKKEAQVNHAYNKKEDNSGGLSFNIVKIDESGIQKVASSTKKKNFSEQIRIRVPSAKSGASGGAKLLQSMDGNVQAQLMAEFPMLNIFDAGMYNFLDATEMSQKANEIFYNTHLNYNMYQEVVITTNRFVSAFNKHLSPAQQGKVLGQLRLSKSLKKLVAKEGIGALLNHYYATALQVNKRKKAILESSVAWQQFPDTGNAYIPPHAKELAAKKTPLQKQKTIPDPPSRKDASPELAAASDARTNETSRVIQPKSQLDLFGSAPGDFDTFTPRWDTQVNAQTFEDTFNRLQGNEHDAPVGNMEETPEHLNYLRGLIRNVIKPGLEKLDDILISVGDIPESNRGKYVRTSDGRTIYVGGSTSSLKTQADMSAQEVLVHETVHAVLGYGIQHDAHTRRELKRLFDLAVNAKDENGNPVITYEAFLRRDENGDVLIAESYEDEKRIAQERFDYVFNTRGEPNGYLHEFAAIGLTNEAFIQYLAKVDATPPETIYSGSLVQRLVQVYRALINKIIGHKYQNTNGKVDGALRELAIRSSQIQGTSIYKLDKAFETFFSYNSKASKILQDHILKPYGDYVESRVGAETNIVRKTVDVAIGLPHMIQVKEIRAAISQVARNAGFTRDNTFYNSIVELRGATQYDQWLYNLNMQNKHDHDQVRERMAGDVPLQIIDAFKSASGKVPSKSEWRSINKMFKADIQVLLPRFTAQQIAGLLTNPKRLEKAIKMQRGVVNRFTYNRFYKLYAQNLGKFQIDGKARLADTLLNAHNIANIQGDARYNVPDIEVEAAEEEIDVLASLYAMQYMQDKDKRVIAKWIKQEYKANPDENGMQMMLGMHSAFVQDSLDQLFSGNKVSLIKGWTFEMYSQYRSSEVNKGDPETEEEMQSKGYEKMVRVPPDTLSNLGKKDELWLYVSKDGLLNKRETGATSLTSLQHKGADIPHMFKQDGKVYNIAQASAKELNIHKRKSQQIRDDIIAGKITTLDDTNNYMVPVISPKFGTVENYRYMMNESNKENFMGKKDMAHFVMGRMMASLIDKVQTPVINTRYLKGAKEDYDANYINQPDEFVFIGPNSTNPKYKEIYMLWPDSMKYDAKRIWHPDAFDEDTGKQLYTNFDEGIWVREDTVNLAFGYRKLSITDYIDKNILPLPAALKRAMKHSGNIWQAIVSRAKRNIVIMIPTVLQRNMVSNEFLLIMNGVPPAYSLKYQVQGVQLVEEYRKMRKDIEDMQRFNKATPNSPKIPGNLQKIARLKEDLKASPIHYLIENGIFQNISEDIREDNESKVGEAVRNAVPWFDNFLDMTEDVMPKYLQRGYDEAIIAPGTELNTLLTRATQYSDFISRYTLFKYLTEEKKMEKRDALNIAVDTFINYDVPTSPQMQWLNDMGILLFTKFLFRIQRILLRRVLDAPLTVGGIQAAQMLTADVPDVYDDILTPVGLANRFPGPLNVGDAAFEINALNQIDWFPWLPFSF